MKEKLEELFDGLKERLKSNFLLTFIVIWLIHHWRFVFILFNFDEYYYLDSKIVKLENYLEDETKRWNLWYYPIIWTFVSISAYYLFSTISELLFIGYNNARKKIYEKFENKKIRYATEYNELNKAYTELGDRYNKQFNENMGLTTQKELYEKKAIEAVNALNLITEERDSLNKLRLANENTIEELKKSQISDEMRINTLEKENVNRQEGMQELIKEKEKVHEDEINTLLAKNSHLEETISELNQKILTLDNTREQRYSVDVEDLFPQGSDWVLISLTGNKENQRSFNVNNGHFSYENGDLDKISGFQMDKINKSVYFQLSNAAKGYFNNEVRLIIENNGEFMTGTQGQNQPVRYKRLHLTPSEIETRKSRIPLSVMDLVELSKLFGENKWKIKHLPDGNEEFFTYQNGSFIFANFISVISNFSNIKGHLVFSRTLENQGSKTFITELDSSNLDMMTGMEMLPRRTKKTQVIYERIVLVHHLAI